MGCLFVLISVHSFFPVSGGVLKSRLEIFCKWANTPCDKTNLTHTSAMCLRQLPEHILGYLLIETRLKQDVLDKTKETFLQKSKIFQIEVECLIN